METLTPEQIRAGLATRLIPGQALCFDQVGSTMDVVREQLQAGGAEGLLAVAEEQTAGRGRQGRTWVAPPGTALLFSLGLRPTWLAPADAPALVWMAGVAICEGIAATTGLAPRLKWPNDVLLPISGGWAKTAGILLEVSSGAEQLGWAILGCGINVSSSPPGETLRTPATDLATSAGVAVDRLALLRATLTAMDTWYTALQQGERTRLFAAWRDLLVTIGQPVMVQVGAGELRGLAEGVDESGALLVRDEAGVVHGVSHGDVSQGYDIP